MVIVYVSLTGEGKYLSPVFSKYIIVMFVPSEENISIKDMRMCLNDLDIAKFHLGISKIPCLVKSPLRNDRKPSFSYYINKHGNVCFKDFATGLGGNLYDLLGLLSGKDSKEVIKELYQAEFGSTTIIPSYKEYAGLIEYRHNLSKGSDVDIQVHVRDWEKHDVDYWLSFGVPIELLIKADVHPISHEFITKGDDSYCFSCEKHAYAFHECKEGKHTFKIYQPNSVNHKWLSNHDKSVISLWTMMPESGESIIIASSLKDALCLMANTSIPCIAMQGEGFIPSKTAQQELRRRFKNVYILLDNDAPGREFSSSMVKETGFTELVLPCIAGCKDVSDLYKAVGPLIFGDVIRSILKK